MRCVEVKVDGRKNVCKERDIICSTKSVRPVSPLQAHGRWLHTKRSPSYTRNHDHNKSMLHGTRTGANDGPRRTIVKQSVVDNMRCSVCEGYISSKRKVAPPLDDRRPSRRAQHIQPPRRLHARYRISFILHEIDPDGPSQAQAWTRMSRQGLHHFHWTARIDSRGGPTLPLPMDPFPIRRLRSSSYSTPWNVCEWIMVCFRSSIRARRRKCELKWIRTGLSICKAYHPW